MKTTQKMIINNIGDFLNKLSESFYNTFIHDFDFEKFRDDNLYCGNYFMLQLRKTFKQYENYKDQLIRKNVNVSEINQCNKEIYFIVQILNYNFKIGAIKNENIFYVKRIIDFCQLIDYSHFANLNDPNFKFSTNSSNINMYSIRCDRKFVSDFFTYYFENIFKMMVMDYNKLIKAPKIHFRRIIFDYKNIKDT